MDDSDNMSTDDNKSVDNISTLRTKPKKRSLVERELETNLTARVTSPVTNSESTSLSRYGRARRLKTEIDSMDMKRLETPKPIEKSPMKVQSPVYKMHASNTPIKIESPKKPAELYLDNQIENIYQENISLSRFASEEIVTSSPLKKKVYIQKDLIQRKDTDSPIMLIKHMFSPDKSSNKLNSHLSNILDRSERFNMNMSKQNGYSLDNSSVVKTLDFDSKKKKKENKDKMPSKNELFELEAKCMYQVGDLAWARMGTYPFWPCIITRDPESGMFVKKKLFGRVEHDIIHVTFFGDNGRRSWIVDNMLRNYTGLAEFESTREQFTAEDKKRDPRLYAAFFISEKKQALWKTSVDEAETLFREPKRFRIDLFNDMLEKSRAVKTTPKLQKKITRTDSDVSLSESLYDSLFSEDDGKVDDTERSRNKSRNKSLDVSEVVTACLDNMAAKTGITKIQKQSHMDRWLQKAKSQTPEKVNVKTQVIKVIKINNNKKWKIIPRDMFKPYSLRRSGNESLTLLFNQNEHDYSKVLPDTLKEETKITDVLKMEPASDLNKLMDVNVEKLDNISSNDDSLNKSNIIELGSKVAVNLDEVNKNAEQEKNLLPTEICLQSNVVCKFIKDKVTSSNEMNIELHRELSNNSFESIEVKNVEEDLLTQSTLTCTPLKIQSDTEIEQQQKINLVSESETQLQEIDPNTDQQNITSFINEASEIQRTPNVHTMNKSHENDVKKFDNLSCVDNEFIKDIETDSKPEKNNSDIKGPGNHSIDNLSGADFNESDTVINSIVPCKEAGSYLQDMEVSVEITNVNKNTESYNFKESLVNDYKVDNIVIDNVTGIKTLTDCNNIGNNTSKEIGKYITKHESSSLAASNRENDMENMKIDSVDHTPGKEDVLTLQDCSIETVTTTTTVTNSSTLDCESIVAIKSDEKVNEIDTVCTLADTNLQNISIHEANVTHSISEKIEKHSGTEIVIDPDEKLLLGNNVTIIRDNVNSLRNFKDCDINNVKVEPSKANGVEATKLCASNKPMSDCIIKETTSLEMPNDLNDIPSGENEETEVGTCNLNLENNCKISEEHFSNNKSKADNFIFLDKSTDKSIDLSKNINGHSDAVNYTQSFIITKSGESNSDIFSSDSLKKMSINLSNGHVKTNNLLVSECEEDDNSIMSMDENCEIKKDAMLSFDITAKVQLTDKTKLHRMSLNITEGNQNNEKNKQIQKNIEQDALLINDIDNIPDCGKNNDCIINTIESNESTLIYTLNSPNLSEKEDAEQNTTLFLDIGIPNNLNENVGTRNFLDSLKSLELAICNDIAKLDMPFKETEELSPISPKIKCVSPGKNYENQIRLIDTNKINTCEYAGNNKLGVENKTAVIENSKLFQDKNRESNIIDIDIQSKELDQQPDDNLKAIVNDCHANDDENRGITKLGVESKTDKLQNCELFEDNNQASNIIDIESKEPKQEFDDISKLNENGCNASDGENEGITKLGVEILENPKLFQDINHGNNIIDFQNIEREQKIDGNLKVIVNHCDANDDDNRGIAKLGVESKTGRLENCKLFQDDIQANNIIVIESKGPKQQFDDNFKLTENGCNASDDEKNEITKLGVEIKTDVLQNSKLFQDKDHGKNIIDIQNKDLEQKSDGNFKITENDCEANDDENKVIIQLDVENTTDKLENSKPSEDKNYIGSINDIDIQTKEPEQQLKDNSKISENYCDVNDDSNKGITNLNKSTVNKHIETKYVEQGTKNYLLKKIGLQNEAGSEAVKLQLEGDNESKIITTNNYENMSNEPEDNTSTLVSNLETNKVTPVPKIHNKLIENIKESHYIENYYHDSDSQDFKDSDDDFDIDAVSVNSEDSVVSLNKTDKYYKRKLRAKADRPLEDPDFLQYLEMRQDSLTDENPGLTDDEIITYLYKTYLYEESQKSDLRKTDDIEQSSMVKGLNDRINKKNRVSKSIRECLFEKKKNKIIKKDLYEEADNASVTSDSDVSWSNENVNKSELVVTMLDKVNSKGDRIMKITKVNKEVIKPTCNNSINCEAKQTLLTDYIDLTKKSIESKPKVGVSESIKEDKVKRIKKETDLETESIIIDSETEPIVSEEMDVPLIFRKTRSKVRENVHHKEDNFITVKDESDNVYVNSEKTDILLVKKKKIKSEKNDEHKVNIMENLEFVQYLELRQDTLIEENPQLTHDEIVQYLHKTWLFEEEKKSEQKKADEIEQSGLVKGLKQVAEKSLKIKFKKKHTIDVDDCNDIQREKPKRKASKPFYNEEYTDLEDELEFFEIFKQKTVKTDEMSKENLIKISNTVKTESKPLETGSETVPQDENESWADEGDEVEFYFEQLTQPKPNIFKGLIREKVCEICEAVNNLIKCKSCHGMFHIECIRKVDKVIKPDAPTRGRKKKKGRKHKNLEDSESQSDEKGLDVSEEQNLSIEENEPESFTVNADIFEHQLSAKMKEVLENIEAINYDSYSSDDGIDWIETVPGKCEIIDIKLKRREKPIDYSNFKCNNCRKYDTPVCFVCKSATSKTGNDFRQKCNIAHCYKYYHLECLDHWPQTQFNAGEIYKNNKKVNDNKYFEALTCPRHVCHTCVSDDPRGCKTRFSGDKLARCVRCPATYHSFTKCLPAGTKILTGSNVICPRHYEHRPGKVPCHVNTGWCFICALGGTLICCEYCPTSFHAECLNIDPPEGGYMCEDCETGRLPLYGEMVWVKLGNYRWWPGLILHPSEIPENIMSVRHSLGEFVVRFFGQYDYYWVNRGRVFPFQEGDSGRVSSQKSKIDAAFTTAMEHAQRACEIMKLAEPNEEESLDIASSLLPPHYVKLKTNKPVGSVCMKKMDDPELSLTQCECDPNEEDPCGPYSQCLNRMLLTECGPTCRAGDRCNNRAFEKRLYPKLTPYRTHHRGWGLKTLEDIKAGQFVIEYVGELIDEEEFQRRMRRKHEIRDENYYFLTLDKERMIDAGPKGNLARFMNHCCEPNCETQKWTVLGDVRVGLFAIHNIPADSEVTFNYNLECAGIEKKRCLCGTKRCSGYMGAKPKQDESQTKKNKLQNKRTYKKHKPDESPSTSKPQKRLGRPRKNKELTELEKDLLIIKSATNLSSDDSDFVDRPKVLKRKRMSFSSDDKVLCDSDSSNKRSKTEVGD